MRYRCISLAGVSAADRQGALQAQLSAWQPFPDAIFLVDLLNDQAQVFALARDSLVALGDRPPSSLWPESLLHEPAEGTTLRLVACVDGFEGQAWRDGVLAHSRWWASQPDRLEWLGFVRQSQHQAGVEGHEVPPAQALPWMKPARSVVRADQLGRTSQANEGLLVGAVAMVLLAFSGATVHELWDASQARSQTQQYLSEIKQEVAPLLAARDQAMAAADQSAALIAQLQAPLPLEVMQHLSGLLPKNAMLKELDLTSKQLRIALELPADLSRAKLVAELESGGWFRQVSEVRDGMPSNWVSFEMQLAGARPPLAANADAGLTRTAAGVPPPPPEMALPRNQGKP